MAGANTTHYVYGLNGLLYGEYDNAGDLIREYVYLDSTPLAQVDAGAPETVIYLHPDHLGTPRFGTNSGGTQVWAWSGDAFGVGAPSGSATVNIRMPGQYVDAESGLFYNWNRYYNPAIGRYISSDPIGIEGGLNTFLYANASPVMYVDPEGLDAITMALENCARNPNLCATSFRGAATVAAPAIAFCTTTPVGWVTCSAAAAVAGVAAICYATSDEAPSAADCNTAIKLLEQAIRLAEKNGAKLTEDRKKKLQDKINDGTITSDDLPGGIRKLMPGKFKGMTLNEIRKLCGKSR